MPADYIAGIVRLLPRTAFLLVVALALSACLFHHRRPPAAPAIFPLTTEWTAQVGDPFQGPAFRPPLATDGTRVFVATLDGTVHGLDGGTGEERWAVASRPGPLSARPGLLVAREPDGTVWAMAPASGSARWKAETHVAGALPAALGEDAVYVGGEGLVALDAASGSVRWTADPPPHVSAVPVAAGKWVFVPEQDGTLRCREAATGAAVWAFSTGAALRAGPAVDEVGRRVLLGTADRRFVALTLEQGRARWTWKVGADVPAPPAILADTVLFASHEDVLYALKRGGGNLVWRAPLPSRPLSPPLVVEGAVLVACYGTRPKESFVVGFDGPTGRRLGDMKTPSELAAPPILVGQALVAGLRDQSVVRFALAGPETPEGVDKPPQALPD
jgi:outer membrane protein assembly factor BamB